MISSSTCLRAFVLSLALGGICVAPSFVAKAQAAESSTEATEAPKAFVGGLVDTLRALATSSDDGDDERKAGFRDVLVKDMEIRRMQRFLLSSEQRKSASEDDLTAYNQLFPDYIAAAYADSIDELVSRTVKINDVVERRPGDFIVRSKLYADDGGERAGIDWRVLEVDGEPRLVDVMVDGLSFNIERRAQFTAIIQKDGFGALLDHMNEQIEVGGTIE